MPRPDVSDLPHTSDEDCTVGPDGSCVDCGVAHGGDPCSCGGRAFHRSGCPESDASSTPAPSTSDASRAAAPAQGDRSKPIDADLARRLLEDLRALVESVRYTAPEIMGERRERAALLLNELADAFGLERDLPRLLAVALAAKDVVDVDPFCPAHLRPKPDCTDCKAVAAVDRLRAAVEALNAG